MARHLNMIIEVSKYVVTLHLKFFTDFIFNNREFLSNFKIAKVVPIFKNDWKKVTNKYRPILILIIFLNN